jgi:hypothetical protein
MKQANLKLPKITARDILEMLRVKHADAVFVSECKNGPTQSVSSHSKLDAWVMEKSWAHPRVIGYESKVTRADFVQDNKWPAYLPLCNELYFVAPKGIIKPEELSADVGLMEVLGTSRLVIRKKAAHRDVKIPENLFRYILMCRAKVGETEWNEMRLGDGNSSKLNVWRSWLAGRDESKELGYEVARSIRDHVDAVKKENKQLKEKMLLYDDIRQMISAMGENPDTLYGKFNIQMKVKELQELIPQHVLYSISHLQRQLKDTLKTIEDAQQLKKATDFQI